MRKFNRITGRRRLFKATLAHSLITKGRMTTTVARAKEIRPIVERLVTVGKGQELSDFRRLLKSLPKATAAKLFYEIAPRYKDRKGGYLRITKLAKGRVRDAAPMARIEFV